MSIEVYTWVGIIKNMDEMRHDHIKEEVSKVKKELRERTLGYMVAAFGLVAGLAWNDAIRGLIDTLFPKASNTIIAKFIYAAAITIVVILISHYLLRIFRKEE
ncbi:MAG: DUF5654 family protein [Candidatus Paceibacterota bacterium]